MSWEVLIGTKAQRREWESVNKWGVGNNTTYSQSTLLIANSDNQNLIIWRLGMWILHLIKKLALGKAGRLELKSEGQKEWNCVASDPLALS